MPNTLAYNGTELMTAKKGLGNQKSIFEMRLHTFCKLGPIKGATKAYNCQIGLAPGHTLVLRKLARDKRSSLLSGARMRKKKVFMTLAPDANGANGNQNNPNVFPCDATCQGKLDRFTTVYIFSATIKLATVFSGRIIGTRLLFI